MHDAVFERRQNQHRTILGHARYERVVPPIHHSVQEHRNQGRYILDPLSIGVAAGVTIGALVNWYLGNIVGFNPRIQNDRAGSGIRWLMALGFVATVVGLVASALITFLLLNPIGIASIAAFFLTWAASSTGFFLGTLRTSA